MQFVVPVRKMRGEERDVEKSRAKVDSRRAWGSRGICTVGSGEKCKGEKFTLCNFKH